MRSKSLIIPIFYLVVVGCKTQNTGHVYKSENLIIQQVGPHSYVHISYLETSDFGRVACNGLVVAGGAEAVIFDTPANDRDANELIHWIEEQLNSKIVGVIPTHFHIDCLGGLKAFHNKQIPSYGNHRTIQLAGEAGNPVPEKAFEQLLELSVDNVDVIVQFHGEGHTTDNVTGYVPSDGVLFGGCLVKSVGAGKGNLEDASVTHWSKTVKQIKLDYPTVSLVVPGHGRYGGPELLDYTVTLFDLSVEIE